MEESIGYIFSVTVDNKDTILISSLSYHKSIINSVLRSYSTNENCDCTVHPEYLIGKAFFNCQEEYFYQTDTLRNILESYGQEYEIDSSTQNLINYLRTYSNEQIRFDDVYSFYVSKSNFNQFVIEMTNFYSRECAWWCPLGCGSDHGCCGNYEGCCLYRHELCYIHDKLCTNCKPVKFLPGCVPDKPQKNFEISIY